MKFQKTLGVIGLTAAVAFAYPLAASAESTSPSTGATGNQGAQSAAPAAQPLTQEDLQAFVDANTQVAEISQKWSPRFTEAETAEEQAQIRRQAEKEMIEAVEESGLTPEQYSMIAVEAQRNPEVQRLLEQYHMAQ